MNFDKLSELLSPLTDSWILFIFLLGILHFSTKYLRVIQRPKLTKEKELDEATQKEVERLQNIYKLLKYRRRNGFFRPQVVAEENEDDQPNVQENGNADDQNNINLHPDRNLVN